VLRSASRISIEAQNGFARNNAARNGYSDNGKFCNDLKRAENAENVRTAFENTKGFHDFQAGMHPGCYLKWQSSANVGIGGCGSRNHFCNNSITLPV